MRCERAQELFSEYCEGALQTALTVPLESHLDSCAECRTTVLDLKEVWRILDAPMAVAEPPDGFRTTVWSRIDAEEEKNRLSKRSRFAFEWRLLFTRPALGWAAAVLLVVVLSGVYIPMRFTAARMMFPWSLFYSEAAPTIFIGDVQTRMTPNGTEVLLPVRNTGSRMTMVRVRVESGPVKVAGYTNDVIASPGFNRSINLFTYTPQVADEPVRLRVEWEQSGQVQSKVFIVPIQ